MLVFFFHFVLLASECPIDMVVISLTLSSIHSYTDIVSIIHMNKGDIFIFQWLVWQKQVRRHIFFYTMQMSHVGVQHSAGSPGLFLCDT